MVYKWYILPIGWLYATYHLLREPGNSIKEEHPVQKLCYENWSTRKKNRMLLLKKKYVQESQVNLDYLTTKKHSPTNISTLSIWSSFFLKPQQNHMLFFPMFWHFCVAPTNRPQDSGQFLYKSLTWMFRPFWGPENSLIKPTFWGFPNRRELGRYTVNCLAS